MWEKRIGHVLIEEGCRVYEVESYPIWSNWHNMSAFYHPTSSIIRPQKYRRCLELKVVELK